jgi:hypothetical protein
MNVVHLLKKLISDSHLKILLNAPLNIPFKNIILDEKKKRDRWRVIRCLFIGINDNNSSLFVLNKDIINEIQNQYVELTKEIQ